MDIPPIARVRQSASQPEVADVAHAVRSAILSSRLRERVRPGGSLAVTVGSRGVSGIRTIARATVDTLKSLGFQPFIVAAMGSHGGGTAEGQKGLLAEFEITDATMGCPVRSEMETVVLGTNSFGLPIHFDKNAFEADGVVLLNRIKPHTSFTGRYESGLLKMLAIGLGKREGAAQVHKLGLPGLRKLLPEVGAFLLGKTRVALGLAILENAAERTARIEAVEPEQILEIEPQLLDEARTLMARLPFEQIDVLIVGELGKNYSGTGLDPNVIGRQRVETMPDLPSPLITRLAVLDLSPETRGNANGIGLADLTTERAVRALDPQATWVNCFTSNFLARARVPLAFPSDREVIAACLDTCWRTHRSEARAVIIPNTLELTSFWITQPLAAEVDSRPGLTRETDFQPIRFDASGNLVQEQLFPQSVRGLRGGPRRFASDFSSPRVAARRFRAVVFDLDGLLFDTEALFFRVAGEAMAVRGKEFTLEMMRAMIGRRSSEAYPAFQRLAGLEEPIETVMAEIRRRFFDLIDTAVHPTPGLIVLLDALRKAGLPIAVATSSRREYAERLLRDHQIWDRFVFVLTSEDVTRGKPHPEIYQTAAARFGVSPDSVLVLEDSPAGLAAAKDAGTFAVGVPHDHSPADDMADADLVVPRLDDPALLDLVASSPPPR